MADKRDEKLLSEMRDRFKRCITADQEERRLALEDMRFVLGGEEQWDEDARQARRGRPMLTVNKLPKFVRQVTGDQRQNRPSIKVRPVDSEADPQIAKILEGHIKNIEYNSNASMAYDVAFKQAVAGGYPGFWRINTEYCEDDSFDQDIVVEAIYNQFTVYCDPETILDVYQGRLAWAFVTDTISKEEFERRFGKDEEGQEWEQGEGESQEGWYLDNSVRIAEYWTREPVKKTIYLLETGKVIDAEKVKDMVQELPEGKFIFDPSGQSPPIAVVKERRADGHKIMWRLVCGNKVLEGPTEWAGKFIPLIPVFGDTWVLEGKTHYKSLVRDAKDPQRVYNYMTSQNVEMAALSPKVPWMLTPKQIEGHENLWNTINITPRPYGLYNPDPLAPGAPRREQPVSTNPAYIQMALQATDDLKDTTGIYDPSLGQRSNETSGRAIIARQREGDIGTFEYIDNLTRAIQFTGKVLVDLIPKIYDTERTIRVLGVDEVPQQVEINKEIPGADGSRTLINDITVGKYDVHVTAGPSFTTQRMEAAEVLPQIIQAVPNAAPVLVPKWIKLMDWPDAAEIAAQLEQLAQGSQEPQQPPISASVAIDLTSLRPDVADQIIQRVLEQGQIKATFKEQPDKMGNMVNGAPEMAEPSQEEMFMTAMQRGMAAMQRGPV